MGDSSYEGPKASGLIASRTPIQFRPAVEAAVRQSLPEYEQIINDTTSEYILLGYHRLVRDERHIFMLIQGARYSGRICGEIGISHVNKFPYYRLSDEPNLGTLGYRERVGKLVNGQDFAHAYGSNSELVKVLRDLVGGYLVQSMRLIGERTEFEIEKAKSTWLPIYEEWQLAEDSMELGAERRYPGLVFEDEARAFIQNALVSHQYDRFLGPLKFKYRDAKFFSGHVYLMARGLEFLTPPKAAKQAADPAQAAPETSAKRMITWADILGPVPSPKTPAYDVKKDLPEPLGDAIAGITGRHPQSSCVTLSSSDEARRLEYAFLKSFSVVEALMG